LIKRHDPPVNVVGGYGWTMLGRHGRNAGDQRMRVLAIIALAMWLAGCEGDRIKQSQTAPVIVATVPCLVM
jgi:hypothetical protein